MIRILITDQNINDDLRNKKNNPFNKILNQIKKKSPLLNLISIIQISIYPNKIRHNIIILSTPSLFPHLNK